MKEPDEATKALWRKIEAERAAQNRAIHGTSTKQLMEMCHRDRDAGERAVREQLAAQGRPAVTFASLPHTPEQWVAYRQIHAFMDKTQAEHAQRVAEEGDDYDGYYAD